MNASLQRQTLDLFEAVLDWPEPEREGRLAEICRGEPALLAAVCRLLRADIAARSTFPTEFDGASPGSTTTSKSKWSPNE